MIRGADTGGTMIRSLLSCLLMLQVLLFSLQVATVQARADAATEYQIQTFPLERNGVALHLQRLAVAGTQPQRQILLVHGLTYSSHEFDVNYADYSLARYLAARGFAVWTFDVAGYGESQEVEDGFMPNSDYAAEDAAADSCVPSFLVKPEPITEFAETHEFDVVVVGAGESGLSAAHTALEGGCAVAVVQNIDTPLTTGNMAASVDLDQTDEAGVQACVAFMLEKNAYRSNRDLVNIWAHNSQEALAWWAEEAAKGGVESKPHDAVLSYNGYDIHLHANTYFHVEGNHNAAATVIAENLAAAGAEFFYNMPCKQLATDESGAVTGAICEDADGAHHLVHGDQGRYSGLRRLLLQPGDARLLRAGYQGLLAVHRLPRRQRAGGRHERRGHHDAAHPHQDDPRRAGGCAPGDALPLRRPGGQPLHGRDLLPHGLHE